MNARALRVGTNSSSAAHPVTVSAGRWLKRNDADHACGRGSGLEASDKSARFELLSHSVTEASRAAVIHR